MPVIVFVVFVLFGVGYYTREQPLPSAPATAVEAPTIAADHTPWARACEAKIEEAARQFEAAAGLGCQAGTVAITTLPSGVDYVEYTLQTADGALYQVEITEEPDDAGNTTGWQKAPGCHGYDHGFETYRHEHGRLGKVSARSPQGFLFARIIEPAADFCMEQAQ